MKYINFEKIEKININKNNLFVILDFDRTITSNETCDTWDAVAKEEIVGKSMRKDIDDLYKKYRPIELSYEITAKEKEKAMYEWYTKCMDLYYKYNLNEKQMIESIRKSKIIFRKGAKEFLKKAYEEKIPVIILSAGIGNAIEIFLKDNNVYYENVTIISNFIEFDKEGKAIKTDYDKIIHTLNKKLEVLITNDIKEKIKTKNNALIVGDLIEDSYMVNDSKSTIKIGLLDIKLENLDKYKEYFDIVLTNEDANFNEINNIIDMK